LVPRDAEPAEELERRKHKRLQLNPGKAEGPDPKKYMLEAAQAAIRRVRRTEGRRYKLTRFGKRLLKLV
jgi:hypothetical protein